MLSNCCCCSVAKSCLTPCDPVDCSTPGSSVLHYLSKCAQVHVHWVSNAIYISSFVCSLLFTFNLSQHQDLFQSQIFTSGGQSIWSFSFSISPSNGYSVLISFRIDWFDLSAVQGTLKSLFQHHTSKAFFMVQFSHLYMTTEKTKQNKKHWLWLYRIHDYTECIQTIHCGFVHNVCLRFLIFCLGFS